MTEQDPERHQWREKTRTWALNIVLGVAIGTNLTLLGFGAFLMLLGSPRQDEAWIWGLLVLAAACSSLLLVSLTGAPEEHRLRRAIRIAELRKRLREADSSEGPDPRR